MRIRTPVRLNERTIEVDHPGLGIAIILVVRNNHHVRWKEESRYEDIYHLVGMEICNAQAAELDEWVDRLIS
jgi:hypothetical protein